MALSDTQDPETELAFPESENSGKSVPNPSWDTFSQPLVAEYQKFLSAIARSFFYAMGETIPLGDDVFYRSFTCPRKKDTYQLRVDDQAIAYYSETHKMWLRTTVIAVDEDGWIQAHFSSHKPD